MHMHDHNKTCHIADTLPYRCAHETDDMTFVLGVTDIHADVTNMMTYKQINTHTPA